MDIRLLSLMTLVVAVVAFLLGRRTSPGGRTVHRLQREIEMRNLELAHYKEQMTRFLKEMRGEVARMSHAQHDLEDKLARGAKQFKVSLPAPEPSVSLAETDWQAPSRIQARASAESPLVAAACPLPSEGFSLYAPKDYADDFDPDQAAA